MSGDTTTGDDQYARFLVEELLPHVVTEQKLKISANPDDRAICGISSGGICAFTAAWEYPEWFSKVLSHVGSFTNIRGGHHYEAMIRKTDRKPIRVFLQDGENDLDNEHGNWWPANLQMEKALKFKGYDYKSVGGTGGHSGKHGGVILPESLIWLWRDHVVGRAVSAEIPQFDPLSVYEDKSMRFTGGEYTDEEFHYRLLKPAVIEADQQYPLVIFLHGAGERGTDNQKQLFYFPPAPHGKVARHAARNEAAASGWASALRVFFPGPQRAHAQPLAIVDSHRDSDSQSEPGLDHQSAISFRLIVF